MNKNFLSLTSLFNSVCVFSIEMGEPTDTIVAPRSGATNIFLSSITTPSMTAKENPKSFWVLT